MTCFRQIFSLTLKRLPCIPNELGHFIADHIPDSGHAHHLGLVLIFLWYGGEPFWDRASRKQSGGGHEQWNEKNKNITSNLLKQASRLVKKVLLREKLIPPAFH